MFLEYPSPSTSQVNICGFLGFWGLKHESSFCTMEFCDWETPKIMYIYSRSISISVSILPYITYLCRYIYMEIYKKPRPFNHIFGGDRNLRAWYRGIKNAGPARGRKGERKTYHINPYHHITMEFGGYLLNVAKKPARARARKGEAQGVLSYQKATGIFDNSHILYIYTYKYTHIYVSYITYTYIYVHMMHIHYPYLYLHNLLSTYLCKNILSIYIYIYLYQHI